jgi:hypothetical protein
LNREKIYGRIVEISAECTIGKTHKKRSKYKLSKWAPALGWDKKFGWKIGL